VPGDPRKRGLSVLAAFLALGLVPKAFPALGPLFLLYWPPFLVVFLFKLVTGIWQLLRVMYALARNSEREPYLGRLRYSLAAGLLFLLFVLTVRFAPDALPTGSYSLAFDSAVWRAPDSVRYQEGGLSTPRQKMLASLIDELEKRPTRAKVIAMLGQPHPKDFPLGIGDSDIHYLTGPERDAFLGLDSEWIFIWFDDDDRFERYSIYVD
jgi:hypothetical protein